MIPQRELFWNIQGVWIFYLLVSVSILIFAAGMLARVLSWARGGRGLKYSFSLNCLSDLLLDVFLGRRIFRNDPGAGTSHLLVLWGFLGLFAGTSMLMVDHYLYHCLTGLSYLLFSFLMELFGLMLISGLCWGLVRRFIFKIGRLEKRWADLVVPLWLLVAALSGFLLEGSRMAAQEPAWGGWSSAGLLTSYLWGGHDAALSSYRIIWWAHALVSLGLIAALPFTKLFHMLASPTALYMSALPEEAFLPEQTVKAGQALSKRALVFLDACTRCGRCTEVCPSAASGEDFSPRRFLLSARKREAVNYGTLPAAFLFGKRDVPAESGESIYNRIWNCTTCGACADACPAGISTIEVINCIRSEAIEDGTDVPQLLAKTLESLTKHDNPWGAHRKKRFEWSQGLSVPSISGANPPDGLCYFAGCTTSFDTRAQMIARSFVSILDQAGVNFFCIGKDEPCCGDIARRVGEEGLFQFQMENCVELFERWDIRDLVTSSPHCFNSFKNDYPLYMSRDDSQKAGSFRVRHYTQLLKELLEQGKIRFERSIPSRVTFHDPCYLGRYNNLFDAPREIISAIPGVEMVEMEHYGADSLCCGGGGGRMWQEDMTCKVTISERRIAEADAAGAQMVITACPLCLITLEDAVKTAGLEQTLRVLDLNELILLAMGKREK